ncbi:MAG TPA: helix-turn-helix domain-containing protein [Polyangia bacterium]|nr:helix-turn-helix domain-containing protein [Polyangia bacterium]
MIPGGRGERSAQATSPTLRLLQAARVSLLTAKEVAARLRVCTATVYKLCASGALPHVRVLNAVRVAAADLERFIFSRQA